MPIGKFTKVAHTNAQVFYVTPVVWNIICHVTVVGNKLCGILFVMSPLDVTTNPVSYISQLYWDQCDDWSVGVLSECNMLEHSSSITAVVNPVRNNPVLSSGAKISYRVNSLKILVIYLVLYEQRDYESTSPRNSYSELGSSLSILLRI